MGRIHPRKIVTKSGDSVLMRSAHFADARSILKLSYDVIKENDTLITTVDELNLTEEQQREIIHIYNSDPHQCIIVAEYQKEIIGLLTFQSGNLKKYAHHGTIGMIVQKRFRGFGIGKGLLTTLIEWAYFQPIIEKLCLEVLASNTKAISLYKKLGFIEEGRQIHQVKNDNGNYDDIILMGKFISRR